MHSTNTVGYLGAKKVNVGEVMKANDLLALPAPTPDVVIFKSPEGEVSVNGGDFFKVVFNEVSFIQPNSTYIFDRDVLIAWGKLIN